MPLPTLKTHPLKRFFDDIEAQLGVFGMLRLFIDITTNDNNWSVTRKYQLSSPRDVATLRNNLDLLVPYILTGARALGVAEPNVEPIAHNNILPFVQRNSNNAA